MKIIIALIAVLAIFALITLSAAAYPVAVSADSGIIGAAALDSTGVVPDAVAQKEDPEINLDLATTLIITCCSVVTAGVIAAVVILGRKNRH